MKYCYLETPIGKLLLAGDEEGIRFISFPKGKGKISPGPGWKEDRPLFKEAVRQLKAYFNGTLKRFSLSLAPQGTPFQLAVWRALQEIPYGETASYGEVAGKIGRPKASRAVGAANGANPLPIVIPCHRIIGSDGGLTGFGGGLDIKQAPDAVITDNSFD